MFRCIVALGHSTVMLVEREGDEVEVDFCTFIRTTRTKPEEGAARGSTLMRSVVNRVANVVRGGHHWADPQVHTDGVKITDGHVDVLPPAPLSVGCVKTIAATDNTPIRIHGVRGYHSLAIEETQINGGVIGILSNNRLVYMTPGLSRWSMPLGVRLFNDEHKGFLCPLHTSMGPSAGSTRMVVNMIRVRVMCEPTLVFLERLVVVVQEEEDKRIREWEETEEPGNGVGETKGDLSDMSGDGNGKCIIVLVRVKIEVERGVVARLMDLYLSTSSSHHTPTVRVIDERTYVVSINTGAVMRRIDGLGSVDTIMGNPNRAQIWDVASISPYDMTRRTGLFSNQTSMTPFGEHLPEQRAALSGHFLMSAISKPVNTITHRIRPMYSGPPLVVTEHCKDMIDGSWDRFGGLNVTVAMFQCTPTYEDAFLMSDSCAQRYMYTAETVVLQPGRSL